MTFRIRASLILLIAAQPAALFAQDTPVGGKAPSRPVERVATTPLRDLNIVKDKVPPLLEQTMKAPYSRRGLESCASIAAQVRALDGVLGVDLDTPAQNKKNSAAMAVAGSAAGGIIPGESILRHVTGASANAQHYAAAVFAGAVRRGFLKGIGASKSCRAPAAPR
jgi:3-oxoacyl-ACP reductase-like protein